MGNACDGTHGCSSFVLKIGLDRASLSIKRQQQVLKIRLRRVEGCEARERDRKREMLQFGRCSH